MLDVWVSAWELSLLDRLRRDGGRAILAITHDLSTAAHFADRIAVIHLGRIAEKGPANQVVRPQHLLHECPSAWWRSATPWPAHPLGALQARRPTR